MELRPVANSILVLIVLVVTVLVGFYLFTTLLGAFELDPRLSLYDFEDSLSIHKFFIGGVHPCSLPDEVFDPPPTFVPANSPFGLMITQMQKPQLPDKNVATTPPVQAGDSATPLQTNPPLPATNNVPPKDPLPLPSAEKNG